MTIPTALCLTCVDFSASYRIKHEFCQKRVSVFLRRLPVTSSTRFFSSKEKFFSLSGLVEDVLERQGAQLWILPSPSSWVLEQLAEGEAAAASQPPSGRSPPTFTVFSILPSLKMWICLLSLSVTSSTVRCSAGGQIWSSEVEVEVECSSWGKSNSYTFCRSLSFLFCQ